MIHTGATLTGKVSVVDKEYVVKTEAGNFLLLTITVETLKLKADDQIKGEVFVYPTPTLGRLGYFYPGTVRMSNSQKSKTTPKDAPEDVGIPQINIEFGDLSLEKLKVLEKSLVVVLEKVRNRIEVEVRNRIEVAEDVKEKGSARVQPAEQERAASPVIL